MYKCEFCGRLFKSLGGLQSHLRSCHKLDLNQIEEYYILHYKKDGEGIDPITGGKTEFIGLQRGYKRFEKDNPKKLATNTVEHYLLKGLSLEDAKKRVDYTNKKSSEYLTEEWKRVKESGKTRGGWSKKHFIELGYSEDEADIEVKKRANQREMKMSEHRKIARENGTYKLYSNACIEYYLNKGLSQEDAEIELKKRQTTNTIETYKRKYGEIDGEIKFHERNSKWSSDMEEKYHNGEYNRDPNKNGNGINNRNYSNSEKELSKELFDILNTKIDNFFYMSTSTGDGKQYFLYDSGRYYFYDITFIYNDKRKIIEFNGDYWHMNPTIYKPDDYNVSLDLTSQEIWDKFDVKIDIAKKNGFLVFIVWEKDWNENKESVIGDCINFLLNE